MGQLGLGHYTNGAEVFAMLMGCRGLQKLGAINDTIEGDSFSGIQCFE